MGAEVLVGKEVIGLTRDVMNCMKEYAVCKQEEITERKRIKAQLTAITKMIDAKNEMYLMALEQNAEDRKMIYQMAKDTMSLAAKNGDLDMVKEMSRLVTDTYKGAPSIDLNQTRLLDEKPM